MAKRDEDINDQRTRDRDSDASGTKSDSNDRDVSRGAKRKSGSKDDVTDIGTDAQQADGTAAGPSTS